MLLLASPLAQSLESKNFAPASEEADAVVAEQIGKQGEFGDCTGTAIAPRWVLTAGHCIMSERNAAGKIRVGQNDEQKIVDIDSWQIVDGDIALIHTSEDMGLKSYPKLDSEIRTSGTATVYGWAARGPGDGKKLPQAAMMLKESLDDGNFFRAEITDGSFIQPGDSGSPLFYEGTVTGVLSAGLGAGTDGSTDLASMRSSEGAYSAVAPHRQKIEEIISAGPATDSGRTSAILIGVGVAGLVLLGLIATVIVVRRAKKTT